MYFNNQLQNPKNIIVKKTKEVKSTDFFQKLEPMYYHLFEYCKKLQASFSITFKPTQDVITTLFQWVAVNDLRNTGSRISAEN